MTSWPARAPPGGARTPLFQALHGTCGASVPPPKPCAQWLVPSEEGQRAGGRDQPGAQDSGLHSGTKARTDKGCRAHPEAQATQESDG